MIINIHTYRCPKCRKFYDYDSSEKYEAVCPICDIPLDFFGSFDIDTEIDPNESIPTPEEEDAMIRRYFAQQNKEPVVICPYCQSTRCSRISILGRMVSVEFWGLASNKLGKQWHCDDCGSNF